MTGCLTRTAVGVLVALGLTARGEASPYVPIDDPVYEQLAVLRGRGELPAYLGGQAPLTERRVRSLLGVAPRGPGWWALVERAAVRLSAVHEAARPYSTPVHPRDVAGGIALSCEHRAGAPCGQGTAGDLDVEASAGLGDVLAATVRVRAALGTRDDGEHVALDRAHATAELGPVAILAGRDVLVLGPASRTQLAWGDHAPPLDQLRIASTRPLALGDPRVRGSFTYVLGRLRAPQTYPGALVSIVRGQLDLGRDLELGGGQLLQLGGDGAPSFGVVDFLLEHVRRRDASASATDSSNRRLMVDVSGRIDELAGLRLYYQLVFEDVRKRFLDAVRFDADHLVGAELGALGHHGLTSLTIEWQNTGVRSQEHFPRTTGFTTAGRVVGSPLGPDAQSLFAGARLDLGAITVLPWAELARLSSDTYTFVVHGPITRSTHGVAEVRYRAGARLRRALPHAALVELEASWERVIAPAFEPGARATDVSASASLIWLPGQARWRR